MEIWDITDMTAPRHIADIPVAKGDMPGLVYFVDDRHVAVVGSDGVLTVWDLTSPREPRRGTKTAFHHGLVDYAAFSPDRRTAIGVGDNGEIKFWDVMPDYALRQRARFTYPVQILGRSDIPRRRVPHAIRDNPEGDFHSVRWFPDPEDAATAVCAVDSARLTEPDWRRHFGDVPFRALCG
ncbi:hypothetical protein GCM10022243_54310 [Saccharothrix violaceirubra]|uniref:WD40 repeat protein n=1 Tax=Saccharothrix violaceirubra TaxID=413306 RepID=A0A7W7T7Z5_9PSEU|nr:hypothetical protein [Saccharothrix violaceirubra]MBB4966945.1 hypothetical protein [Saccharothrix violaceirubra]